MRLFIQRAFQFGKILAFFLFIFLLVLISVAIIFVFGAEPKELLIRSLGFLFILVCPIVGFYEIYKTKQRESLDINDQKALATKCLSEDQQGRLLKRIKKRKIKREISLKKIVFVIGVFLSAGNAMSIFSEEFSCFGTIIECFIFYKSGIYI